MSASAKTREHRRDKKNQLTEFLRKIGLEDHLTSKLTLGAVLEIGPESVTDEPIRSVKDLPSHFLKRLMMVNVTARSTRCANAVNETQTDAKPADIDSFFDGLCSNGNCDDNRINPLDLITALFLCADSFLQQEMMSKMSMCQFAVPLLLPDCSTNQCTLMLWAMRDIVKEWRPHSLAETRGFVEDSIVCTALPMISFVSLGDCSLSKSQILNQVLSNPQQHHDFFIHRDMSGGDVSQEISNGLVEISWYLPCGNTNLDIFSGPIAIATLQGDICAFETQFSFLVQTSSAVFVFFDSIEENEYRLLASLKNIKSQLILVVNKSQNTDPTTVKKLAKELNLNQNNLQMKNKQINDADFTNNLRKAMKGIVQSKPNTVRIEDMSATALELGISVDEECVECKNAKTRAKEITNQIGRIIKIPPYKESKLPLQGVPWKKLAELEKEECRLEKAGDRHVELYKTQLQEKKKKLRQEQSKHKTPKAMATFIKAIANPNTRERAYFLKWMRLNLDLIARKELSHLRESYKTQLTDLKGPNKNEIADLDKKILESSLGVEHFMREIGQLYEAACFFPEKRCQEDVASLPSIVADLLLDGFPLELVDGDASNIPVRWVTDVLTELHRKVQHKSRVLVVTVLGVQSTGKSTLLNTMFGVQFAVSSGRCTRGAFMLLIRVKENLKEELNCDFILLIDTEGLKSPELAQLENSYEHDNELATLVTGLSDITIINIAMENSTEMKDILQIVVHAFLRMKEVGKKPKCQFVHQNVGGVSAHNKNMTERKHLLEQLNEMTEIAAKMEKQNSASKFTDVMEYDAEKNNWYIPGLWHGIPPMAPVNTGYSEAVYEFKKSLFKVLKHCKDDQPPAHITEFLKWMESLWKSVKYENFIFSFRNTLVADAYNKLCLEFSKWEWSFRKHMFVWASEAEVRISNFKSNQSMNLADLLRRLQSEATQELGSEETKLRDQLVEYYKKKERHIPLVEKYRGDFLNSIKSLKRETENAIHNTLDKAMEIQKGMTKLKDIHEKHTAAIEQKVLSVLEECRKRGVPLSDTKLDEEFENMWRETVYELNFKALDKQDVVSHVFSQLRSNLERHGGSVKEQLNAVKDLTECGETAFKVHSEHFQKCSVFKKIKRLFNNPIKQAEEMATNLIGRCKDIVSQLKKGKTDYYDIYTRELLEMIDKTLEETNNKKLKTNTAFDVDIKLHICGFAAKGFQQMHEQFLIENDPEQQLEKFKTQYKSTFIDLYQKKDQCQKKAMEFVNLCLTPAVKEYVHRTLGIEIVDAILTGGESVKYSSRSFFQFTILKQLLIEGNFKNYVQYTTKYKHFVKKWISNRIVCHFSNNASIGDLEIKCLDVITTKIEDAIKTSQMGKDDTALTDDGKSTSIFIENICSTLSKDIVIPQDTLRGIIFQITAKYEEFVTALQIFLKEMKESLRAEFSKGSKIEKKLQNLPFNPLDELFKRVFGCGEQCPFCKVPCEAGGKDHKEHHASVHRPLGLGRYIWSESEKLCASICSTNVHSNTTFQSPETEWKTYPCKDYRKFYPDWQIAPDPSIEASDYWKYVLTTYNEEFAKEYEVEPADIPEQWRNITKDNAMKSLQELFNVE